jgi:hypothetical protein
MNYFCIFVNNWQTSVCMMGIIVYGLRKIAWTSVFALETAAYLYIYIYMYRYIDIDMHVDKRKPEVFVFLGRQTMHNNRRLLFQQTCPSMHMYSTSTVLTCCYTPLPHFMTHSQLPVCQTLATKISHIYLYCISQTSRWTDTLAPGGGGGEGST